jgi:hypothetical protein
VAACRGKFVSAAKSVTGSAARPPRRRRTQKFDATATGHGEGLLGGFDAEKVRRVSGRIGWRQSLLFSVLSSLRGPLQWLNVTNGANVSVIIPKFTDSAVVRGKDAEIVGAPGLQVKLLAESSATGDALSTVG